MSINPDDVISLAEPTIDFTAPLTAPGVGLTISFANCSDVMCPICMGIISDALTIVECMHRFCAECIKQVTLASAVTQT